MSAGPIPFTAVVEYSRIYDVGDFYDFLFFIRQMDEELLKLIDQESKKKKKKDSSDGVGKDGERPAGKGDPSRSGHKRSPGSKGIDPDSGRTE